MSKSKLEKKCIVPVTQHSKSGKTKQYITYGYQKYFYKHGSSIYKIWDCYYLSGETKVITDVFILQLGGRFMSIF